MIKMSSTRREMRTGLLAESCEPMLSAGIARRRDGFDRGRGFDSSIVEYHLAIAAYEQGVEES